MQNMQKKAVKAKIIDKIQLSPDNFQMRLYCPYIAHNIIPGQFIQIRLNNISNDPLLCRPFAVYQTDNDNMDILFKLVGKGTRLLSQKVAGDELMIIGPLGNGFPIDNSFKTALLVAGGMGIAGLHLLINRLKDRNVIVLLGACSEDMLLGADDLVSLGVCVLTATEDGSCGYKGMVSQLLEEVLSEEKLKFGGCRIYSCGPMPMLKAVAEIANNNGVKAYVSLEEKMACGLGACMGCAIEIKSDSKKYKLVCKDGPVFDAQEIAWK
ncbi:TPA: dihydroorotate dehydrogenase electron transfer subunit [bacterium]|nr:dihydroorotate dehydrogenase electron transfer subunit [bacterium]